jgi:hypothetical protein
MITKPYVLNKYLPAHAGRIEINVTAKSKDDYDITNVYFIAEKGPVQVKEEITFFMLSMRLCGNDCVDEWIAELLPAAIKADTFLDDADKAYEVAGWNGICHLGR